jgi:predicted adenine nucleotide alpha hydrolase (AANH) superfamily ATPase
MTDQSVSPHFRTLFEVALEDYEIKTKLSLEKHPLAQKLQNCHSVESITALLQDQARAFSEARGRDRITKSIRCTVSFLYKLSATAALGDDLGLVRQTTLVTVFHVSNIDPQAFPPAKALQTGLGVLLTVCAFL